jgi:hypothetical protein
VSVLELLSRRAESVEVLVVVDALVVELAVESPEWCMTSSSIVRLPSWFKSAAAVELPKEPISLDCRIMSPFLSFFRTISVAQAFSRAFADSFAVDEEVVDDELLELLPGLPELEGVELVEELLDLSSLRLSSLRRSSLRRSSSRERLPRISPRPRSLYRLRQLRPSRLSPSERELRLES